MSVDKSIVVIFSANNIHCENFVNDGWPEWGKLGFVMLCKLIFYAPTCNNITARKIKARMARVMWGGASCDAIVLCSLAACTIS